MKARRFPKSQKLVLLILPLLAVVMISGCTGSGGATFGTGVTILNWEPTFSSVESNDNLQFRLRVQNQGEALALGVTPIITGIVPEDWGLAQYTGFGYGQSFDLEPPDRIQNTEGEIRQITFDVLAPDLPKGTTQTFTPQIRLYYNYETTASKLITLVNDQELKRLQDQGQTLSSKDTVSSAGPLKVTVNAGKFIKAREGGVSRILPITVDIQNVGGGVVSTKGSSANDYKVALDVHTTSGRLGIDCTQSGIYGSNNVITLWKGQSATVTCLVQINSVISTEEANIQAILDYDYYIDASTTVTVTGY
jgi:hypothetical protein